MMLQNIDETRVAKLVRCSLEHDCDLREAARIVFPCPKCGAEAGVPCETPNKQSHIARVGGMEDIMEAVTYLKVGR